jgi:hypothetical protein
MSLVSVLAVLSVIVAIGAIAWWALASRRHHAELAARLPVGADAALWSIVEVVPDPRNHLALTRDLTGEVRITGTPLDVRHLTPVGSPRAAGTVAAAYGDARYDKAS